MVAAALTGSFMLVEAAAGLYTGSLALLADAGHMLTDTGALVLALFVAKIAARPRDAQRTYGYRRAEVLGAFVNAGLLVAIAASIAIEAIPRFWRGTEIHGEWVMVTAALGLVLNLAVAVLLHGAAQDNVNVRGALLHVFADALGSVAALAAGLGITYFDAQWADPAASLVICGLIGWGAVGLLRETAHLLLEGAPAGLSHDAVERVIQDVPGVHRFHDLHVWALTPDAPLLSVHVEVDPAHDPLEVVRQVREALADIGISHSTVQPEGLGEIAHAPSEHPIAPTSDDIEPHGGIANSCCP